MKFRPLALLLFTVLLLPSLHSQDAAAFIVNNGLIRPPAAAGSTAAQLVNSPDGSVYLSWLEPAPAHHTALRFSRFDTATHAWGPARTIGEGLTSDVPRSQTPCLAITAGGHLTALWQPTRALTILSTSTDGGANWSRPVPLNRPHHLATRATIAPLPNGQTLAAWIEPDAAGGALVATTSVPKSEPVIVASSVSAGCQPALGVFPDGSALVAYRALTAEGVRDIATARFHDGGWDPSVPLNSDGWKSTASPNDGPSMAVRGTHVVAAWFTATPDPRINVSSSDNAGAQWLIANRVDDIAPLGHPDLVLFDDGSQLVSWVERSKTDGLVVLIRRISARGNLSEPIQVGPVAVGSLPVLARVKDGDTTPAQVLVVTLAPVPNSQLPTLTTHLLTFPPQKQLAEADPCDCDPRPQDLRGYPIKGRIVSVDAVHGTLQLDHVGILGVINPGQTVFQIGPEVLRAVHLDSVILARIERTGPDWTLFNVRVLAAPAQAPLH